MKAHFRLVTVLCMLLVSVSAFSQTIAEPYQVGIWQGFRSSAVSFTFDDGCANQFAIAIPMFDEFGFKLTMFTVTSPTWPDLHWDKLLSAAQNGHEIASHSVTHTNFSSLNDSLQTWELKTCKEDIIAQIPGEQCITHAYPYCAGAKKAIMQQFYEAGRVCSGSIVSKSPSDFYGISSIICGDLGSIKTTDIFITRFNSAIKSKGWCVFLLHGIDGDGGYSPLSSTVLRETLEYINTNQNDLWIETFGNVVRYIKERNALSVSELAVQDTCITVQVTDTLNDTIFTYPVSIRRPLPEGWAAATVTQNGKPASFTIIDTDSTDYVQFDVIPDSGDVVITKNGSTGIKDRHGMALPVPQLHIYPNPFNPQTTINFQLPTAEHVTLKVYNILGKEVQILLNGSLPSGNHSITFNAANLESGVYFCKLEAPNLLVSRKMLLLQ